jgi:hypothetical protein
MPTVYSTLLHFQRSAVRWPGVHWLCAVIVPALLLLGACQSTDSSSADQGEVVISMTDAEGDFLTYTVDVVSLQLHRHDGAVVSALPQTTTIDFAQYVDVSEFLTAASVPAGRYDSASVTLDFSSAVITVQDDNGNAIAATVVDENNQPLTTTTVEISLNDGSRFTVAAGVAAHFTLDFDLEASNEVVIAGNTATVMVDPVLIADTLHNDPKPHRLRGLLGEVDSAAHTFEVVLRPFLHHNSAAFGSLTASVLDSTSYEIDGVEYSGDAGLAALDTLAQGSAVVAMGALNADTRRYEASSVLAGSSVPWGSKDILEGSVTSRLGNNLTVHGAVILTTSGGYVFAASVPVTLDTATTVFRQGDAQGSYSIDDISVGQRVTILGDDVGAAGDYAMDASAGTVRMHYSQVSGTVASASPLAVDVQRINARRVALYDFSATGSDASSDADPDYYEIATAALPLDGLYLNDPVRVRGFPRAFGQAPEDFSAETIIDVSALAAHLVVGYTPTGSASAISSIDDNGIQLDLNGVGVAHFIERAGITLDLLSLTSAPLLAPPADHGGLYFISQRGRVRVYASYASFQLALAELLAAGNRVRGVDARGEYDSNTNRLQLRRLGIRLAPASLLSIL